MERNMSRWQALHVTKLQLRYCEIGPMEAKSISQRLGTMQTVNKKLISLDLSGNRLGDEGALYIAQIPESKFRRLLLMCTIGVQFQFDNTLYRQIDGVAMGSPLSPVLADIFMSNLEKRKLKHAVDETTSWCRHIDDTFVVFNNESHASYLLRLFNDAHTNNEFTMEHENDGKFHFLDTAMRCLEDGSLQKSIY
ncbi:unnamed protein product [Trichobilharzia regenti]|nr:unnamed protein product [Trichobilharzia regenti]